MEMTCYPFMQHILLAGLVPFCCFLCLILIFLEWYRMVIKKTEKHFFFKIQINPEKVKS